MFHPRLFLPLILVLLAACHEQRLTPEKLGQIFSRREYVTSGDGWAEARRRALLKVYLRQSNIPYNEVPQAIIDRPHDKYRITSVIVPPVASRTGGNPFTATLSLSREGNQQACDEKLIAVINKLPELRQRGNVVFSMDERCRTESLTARLAAEE